MRLHSCRLCTSVCFQLQHRYGEPEWQMEQDVRTGKLHGGMWGIKDRNDPDDLAAAGTSRLAEAAAAAVRRGATGGSDSSHRHVIRAAAGEQQ